ncbi:hypothetical protein MUP32_03050, partial [Candidatus Microgenomates bacterium]|nr:hypothetical protein [Candidatus Microgenomates bacterium]
MNKLVIKIKKLLAIFLIASLLLGRSAVFLPAVYAQGSPPAIPTVPAVPTIPASPSDPPAAPTAPAAPTTPSSASPTSGASQPTDAPATPTDPPAAPLESQSSVTPTGEITFSTEASPTPTVGEEYALNQSDGSQSGNQDDPANIATGPLSTNVATEKNENWQEVLNKNLADLENKISAASSTGFNYANLNTLDGQVFTGDSQTTVNLLNKLNSNISGLGSFQVYNVYGTQFSDIVFKFADNSASNSFNSASGTVSKNAVTGPLSNNYTDATSGFTVKEANGNDATITNDIDIAAITGENSASYNTGSGTVKTGNATALGNIINLANTNLNVGQWLIGVFNFFGTLAG